MDEAAHVDEAMHVDEALHVQQVANVDDTNGGGTYMFVSGWISCFFFGRHTPSHCCAVNRPPLIGHWEAPLVDGGGWGVGEQRARNRKKNTENMALNEPCVNIQVRTDTNGSRCNPF